MADLWVQFTACAVLIFLAGKRIAKYGDIIAEKTGLGGVWIGAVLVAVATSLPELFTGVGSVVFVDAPDLTIGNLFGANAFNLVNIAWLDIMGGSTPLLSFMSGGQILTAALGLAMVIIAMLGIFLTHKIGPVDIGGVGIFSILLMGFYLFSARAISKFEKKKRSAPKKSNEQERNVDYSHITLKKAYLLYAVSALVIVVSGIWLAYIGDSLSQSMGLGRSFVGTLLIGFATTLPEITVSISALRLGAREIAVANMLGSNLFNLTIIFIDDLLYRKAPILSAASQSHIITGFCIIAMTCIVITAIATKPRKKIFAGMSWYSILLIGIFILSSYLSFFFRK